MPKSKSASSEMTYAIIRSGGKQFRVEPGKRYRLPTLVGEPGGKIEFNEVLLGNDGKNVKVGTGPIAKAKVVGEIVRHGKGDKIIIFKMKRRKNYARKQGHRQGFTEVKINDINLG
jgi:large subunit ribosomal protein L21